MLAGISVTQHFMLPDYHIEIILELVFPPFKIIPWCVCVLEREKKREREGGGGEGGEERREREREREREQ